jgi:hypothetical protein
VKKTSSVFAAPVFVAVLTLGLFWTAFHHYQLAAVSALAHPSAELDAAVLSAGSSPSLASSSDSGSDEVPPAVLAAGADFANVLPTPVPGDTLVYFVPVDNDASGTVLYLYNTDNISHTVPLRGFSYNGVVVYSLNIHLDANSFLRLASDSIASAPPPSWATPAPIITNFTDFTYYASLSLPAGVQAEGYTLFNPGTGVVDPRQDQGAIPLDFAPATNSLTVQEAGDGGGQVTSSPSGIDCGTVCNMVYFSGTQITLTAMADANSLFSSWSGACAGPDVECLVSLTDDEVVTSTFALKTFPLSVSTNGSGSGSVTSTPAGIDCGTTCRQDYQINETIILSAIPGTDSVFTGWGGACSGTQDTCTVIMADATSVTAGFTLKEFALSVHTDGHGRVVSNPAGIDCGTQCSHAYPEGTVITLTAEPNADSSFTGWGGACAGSQTTCTLTMTGDESATAIFNLQTLYLPEIRK